ncbi:P-loop ATPase, Sll1717 family [Sorangium sp. So ce233]|uniref:P-loop ATPase, Sll1717 family n=1 Tax=Sorangium sp. So ce233 TaxID=3133290 RepID=UPI003F62436E
MRFFYAYSSSPPAVGQTIESAAQQLRRDPQFKGTVDTWKQIDIPGRFLIDGIADRIDRSDIVLADITHLNFNVIYEIGYAIGKGKRVFLTVNQAYSPQYKEISRLGMFDTLGHQRYENSDQLCACIKHVKDQTPARFPGVEIDRGAPVYLLNISSRTEFAVRVAARIKKSRIMFRNFDPLEQPRLSAVEAYRGVAESVSVVVLLVANSVTDASDNNFRGAFVAGLANGLGKDLLLLQEGDEPVPLDYRDFVSICRAPVDVDRHINELAPRVIEGLQTVTRGRTPLKRGVLATLDLGASAAENEMSHLGAYYLTTDSFKQVLSGSIRLVVGRKGSGKSAMFFQLRDKVRSNRKRIVLDLRPEGYQLKKFKEMVLSFTDATQEHLCAAFWEYVLLLEICHKLLHKDRQPHLVDSALMSRYKKLEQLYETNEYDREGDFSERMLHLVSQLQRRVDEEYGGDARSLSSKAIVNLLYRHNMTQLRNEIVDYLKLKVDVWVLFDNLDKGWPTKGVQHSDILILRGLIDATRDIERLLTRKGVETHTVLFVRNDVYEILVDETPDRGKETRASLEWTDPDLLREVLRLRLVNSMDLEPHTPFDAIWNQICVSHIDGEKSDEHLIERSLMRPRYLLNLVAYCRANAVNLSHSRIEVGDIRKALKQYSADIGNEIGLEVRDVFPEATDVLYAFIALPSHVSLDEVFLRFLEAGIPSEKHKKLMEVLLWFSFFGVVVAGRDTQYSYSVFYDMKKLLTLARGLNDGATLFEIHPAFRPFLEVAN